MSRKPSCSMTSTNCGLLLVSSKLEAFPQPPRRVGSGRQSRSSAPRYRWRNCAAGGSFFPATANRGALGCQVLEKGLGLLQIECVKAFGKPAVDLTKGIARLAPLVLNGPSLLAPSGSAIDPNSAIPVITAALYAHASAKVIVYHENGRE
jgi:hypothetical protein